MFTLILFLGAALAIDQAARDLVGDVRLAMKRADLSLDYVSRVTGVPIQRLSDQLNAKTPFTSFWRFFVGEMRETDFQCEFLSIQAGRVDRMVVRCDLGQLIAKVEQMTAGVKRMAKVQPVLMSEQERAS
jgi:hypothetical protein